jgi:hypothetical protein
MTIRFRHHRQKILPRGDPDQQTEIQDMHSTEPVRFCCRGLLNLFEERGQRGLSLLIKRDGSKYFYILQSNATSAHDIGRLVAEKIKLPFDMTLRWQRAISYCPFCGIDLREWLKKNPSEAERGAELSQRFLQTE